MPPLSDSEHGTIMSFTTGRGYLDAAKLVVSHPEYWDRRIPLAPAVYCLLAFSIEFLLKCFLLKKGVKESELKRRDIRHSIDVLYELCRKNGLTSVPLLEAQLQILAANHKEKEFRYLRRTTKYEPINPAEVVSAIEHLSVEIEREIDPMSFLDRLQD